MTVNMIKENISYAATTANSSSTENNKKSTQTPSTTPKLPEKHLTTIQQINLKQNNISSNASTIHTDTETTKPSTSNTNTLISLVNNPKTQEIINVNSSSTNTYPVNSPSINTNVSIQEETNIIMETDELLTKTMNQTQTNTSALSAFFKKKFNTTITPMQSENTTEKNRVTTANAMDTISLDDTVTTITVEDEPD